MISKSLMSVLALLALFATSLGHTAGDRFDSVRAAIESHIIKNDSASVAVAVAKDGEILWQQGFGWANKEKKIAATENTLYSLASVSKPIAATGLMVLVEKGLVDLDKPVNDYLGDAKVVAHVGDAQDATLRRLANHTSGLPTQYHPIYDDKGVPVPPMDESIRRYGHLVNAPGEVWQYSNFAFGLINYVIERVSGQSYNDFMREHVFLPLGMKHSSGQRPVDFDSSQIAQRYSTNGEPIPFFAFDHPGAAASFASAHDLVRMGSFFLKHPMPGQKSIMSNKNIDEMLKPTSSMSGFGDKPEKNEYGVAWHIKETAGHPSFGHAGGMDGVSTLLTMLPEQGIAIAVLTNSGRHVVTGGITKQIIELLEPGEQQRKVYAEESGLRGVWQGAIETYQGNVPVTVKIGGSQEVKVRVGKGVEQSIWNAKIDRDGLLNIGGLQGQIKTDDASLFPHNIDLKLKLRGESLSGYAVALTKPMPDRLGTYLPYWIELKKQ